MRQSRTISLPEGQYHSLRSKEYHSHIKQKRESLTELFPYFSLFCFYCKFRICLTNAQVFAIPLFYFSDKDITSSPTGSFSAHFVRIFRPPFFQKLAMSAATFWEKFSPAFDIISKRGTAFLCRDRRPRRSEINEVYILINQRVISEKTCKQVEPSFGEGVPIRPKTTRSQTEVGSRNDDQ